MANTYLTRTPSSTGNKQTWTYSAWIKRGTSVTSTSVLLGAYGGNNNRYSYIGFSSSAHGQDQIQFYSGNYTTGSSTTIASWINTDAVYRDFSAWYHIVIKCDFTESSASDVIKIYVNNVLQSTRIIESNATVPGNSTFFDGSMSHVHFIDGTAYAPTEFGEYDANGVWKIKTSPSVTYGTNGFFILKDGNSVTDQSPNTNNFTVDGGTLTKTEDSPSNVFATMNPLDTFNSPTITNGNTVINAGASDKSLRSTLGFSQGKYYWEVKIIPNNSAYLGIINSEKALAVGFDLSVASTNSVIFEGNGGGISKNGSSVGSYTGGAGIYGFAFDLDAGTLKLSKDGVFFNSGNAVVTGISADTYLPFFAPNGGGSPTEFQANFGNGYFGTTAVTTAGINASGIGIFEYDVPTGYTALSTKGLNL
jgi:hypothetical protein